MMRVLLLALLACLLLVGRAEAAGCPPLPYVFIPGTVADANQVNANFNAVTACAAAGTSTVANLTALRAACTSTTGCPSGHPVFPNGVTRLTDGVAAASPLYFTTGTGACSTDDGASCVNSANGQQWNGAFPTSGADPRQFSAIADGTFNGSSGTDDSVSLQNWLNYGAKGNKLLAPPGVFMFATPLAINSTVNGFNLCGAGGYATSFRYFGAGTTADLISIGSLTTQTQGMTLCGFRVSSKTTMTAGLGLHLKAIIKPVITDVNMDTENGDGHLWNGFLCDACGSTRRLHFSDLAQNDADECAGNLAASVNVLSVDTFFSMGIISHSGVGLHAGGGCAGLSVDNSVDILANGTNFVYDNATSAQTNAQVFFGPTTFLDTPTGDNAVINQSGTSAGPQLQFLGWIASAQGVGLNIEACNACQITVSNGPIVGNHTDGIKLQDTSLAWIFISSAIYNNGTVSGWGIDCTTSNYTQIRGISMPPFSNGPGGHTNNINPNCAIQSLGGFANGAPLFLTPSATSVPQGLLQGVNPGGIFEYEVFNNTTANSSQAQTSWALGASGQFLTAATGVSSGGSPFSELINGPSNTGGLILDPAASNPLFLKHLPVTPGSKSPLCADPTTGQVFLANSGVC